MVDLIYKEEVYEIIGACMEVYNTLGYGFLEIVYKDAMEIEFKERGILYMREKELPVFYKGKRMQRSFFADFKVYGKIIVEVKSHIDGIREETFAQTLNYLKASGNKVGVIVNFGKSKLSYRRVVG